MAIKSYSEQLEEVQAAISRLMEDGQAWGQGQRSRSEARLAELEAREQRLRRIVARKQRGGIRRFQAVPRG